MGEESAKPASTSTGAVFLSYALQDHKAAQQEDRRQRYLGACLKQRRHVNVGALAIAAKHARLAWVHPRPRDRATASPPVAGYRHAPLMDMKACVALANY
jgi:hypothetical protein